MSDRRRPVAKKPNEILDDMLTGHDEAMIHGQESGKRYLVNYIEKYNSIPNWVKFFIYDLLSEDAYKVNDFALCLEAVEQAQVYFPAAQEEASQRLKEYMPQLRFIERGISVMVDQGEFETAIGYCDKAIALGLGKAYAAKKASIERML